MSLLPRMHLAYLAWLAPVPLGLRHLKVHFLWEVVFVLLPCPKFQWGILPACLVAGITLACVFMCLSL